MAKNDPEGDYVETTAEAKSFLRPRYKYFYKLLGRLKVEFWR